MENGGGDGCEPHFLGLFKSMSVAQQVLVEDGAEVEAGAPLVVLEAMKMEHAVRWLKSRVLLTFPGSGSVHACLAELAAPCVALHEHGGSGLSIFFSLGTACTAPRLHSYGATIKGI